MSKLKIFKHEAFQIIYQDGYINYQRFESIEKAKEFYKKEMFYKATPAKKYWKEKGARVVKVTTIHEDMFILNDGV